MHLQCTKKTLDWLKPTITHKDTTDDMHAWHVDYLPMGHRKMVVLMHDMSRFCIVLAGMRKTDFKNPVDLLRLAVFRTLQESHVALDIIERYTAQIQDVTYDKTRNRTMVARLNRATFDASWFDEEDYLFNEQIQPLIAERVNYGPVGENQWKIVYHPDQKMTELLSLMFSD